MKLISWNCHEAFRKKSILISELKPDILVIQECEPLEKLFILDGFRQPTAKEWFGNRSYPKPKGIGFFSYTGINFELYQPHDNSIEYVVPLRVRGEKEFNIIGVWATPNSESPIQYIDWIFKAIDCYREFILTGITFIIGDFNSNQSYDSKTNLLNQPHQKLVNKLHDMGLVSAYHSFYKEPQGLETRPTFYYQYSQYKPFHIDFCFLPQNYIDKIKSFQVGSYSEWVKTKLSDHVPLIIDIEG